MLTITERAMTVLAEMRDLTAEDEWDVLVLYPEDDGGIGFGVGEPEEGDEVAEWEGRVVVAVARELAPAVDGLVLDFVEAEGEGTFALR